MGLFKPLKYERDEPDDANGEANDEDEREPDGGGQTTAAVDERESADEQEPTDRDSA